jgi:hypothetical protein
MRFAGNIFNQDEQESEDDSMLSRYFPDLKKIYRPGFKAKVSSPASQPKESTGSTLYS